MSGITWIFVLKLYLFFPSLVPIGFVAGERPCAGEPYAPVCVTTSGVTYGNWCLLEAAGVFNGLAPDEAAQLNDAVREGGCCDQKRGCTREYRPHCHWPTRKEFPNKCHAVMSCLPGSEIREGKCPKALECSESQICTAEYDPHCHEPTGVTYGNPCKMRGSCLPLSEFYEGECVSSNTTAVLSCHQSERVWPTLVDEGKRSLESRDRKEKRDHERSEKKGASSDGTGKRPAHGAGNSNRGESASSQRDCFQVLPKDVISQIKRDFGTLAEFERAFEGQTCDSIREAFGAERTDERGSGRTGVAGATAVSDRDSGHGPHGGRDSRGRDRDDDPPQRPGGLRGRERDHRSDDQDDDDDEDDHHHRSDRGKQNNSLEREEHVEQIEICTREYRPVCHTPTKRTFSNLCMGKMALGGNDENFLAGTCEEQDPLPSDFPVQLLPLTDASGRPTHDSVVRVGVFFPGQWSEAEKQKLVDSRGDVEAAISETLALEGSEGAASLVHSQLVLMKAITSRNAKCPSQIELATRYSKHNKNDFSFRGLTPSRSRSLLEKTVRRSSSRTLSSVNTDNEGVSLELFISVPAEEEGSAANESARNRNRNVRPSDLFSSHFSRQLSFDTRVHRMLVSDFCAETLGIADEAAIHECVETNMEAHYSKQRGRHGDQERGDGHHHQGGKELMERLIDAVCSSKRSETPGAEIREESTYATCATDVRNCEQCQRTVFERAACKQWAPGMESDNSGSVVSPNRLCLERVPKEDIPGVVEPVVEARCSEQCGAELFQQMVSLKKEWKEKEEGNEHLDRCSAEAAPELSEPEACERQHERCRTCKQEFRASHGCGESRECATEEFRGEVSHACESSCHGLLFPRDRVDDDRHHLDKPHPCERMENAESAPAVELCYQQFEQCVECKHEFFASRDCPLDVDKTALENLSTDERRARRERCRSEEVMEEFEVTCRAQCERFEEIKGERREDFVTGNFDEKNEQDHDRRPELAWGTRSHHTEIPVYEPEPPVSRVDFELMDFVNLDRNLNETKSAEFSEVLRRRRPDLSVQWQGVRFPYAGLVSLKGANSYIRRLPHDPQREKRRQGREEKQLCASEFKISAREPEASEAVGTGRALATQYVCHKKSGRIVERCMALLRFSKNKDDLTDTLSVCSKNVTHDDGSAKSLPATETGDGDKSPGRVKRIDPCKQGGLAPVCDTFAGITYRNEGCAASNLQVKWQNLIELEEIASRLVEGPCRPKKMRLYPDFEGRRPFAVRSPGTETDEDSSTAKEIEVGASLVHTELGASLPLDLVFAEDQEAVAESFATAFSDQVLGTRDLETSVVAIQLVNPEAARLARRNRRIRMLAASAPEDSVEVTLELVVIVPPSQQVDVSQVSLDIEKLASDSTTGSNFAQGFQAHLEENGLNVELGSGASFTVELAPTRMSVEDMNDTIEAANVADERATMVVGETEGFDEFWREQDELADAEFAQAAQISESHSDDDNMFGRSDDGTFLVDWEDPLFYGVWISVVAFVCCITFLCCKACTSSERAPTPSSGRKSGNPGASSTYACDAPDGSSPVDAWVCGATIYEQKMFGTNPHSVFVGPPPHVTTHSSARVVYPSLDEDDGENEISINPNELILTGEPVFVACTDAVSPALPGSPTNGTNYYLDSPTASSRKSRRSSKKRRGGRGATARPTHYDPATVAGNPVTGASIVSGRPVTASNHEARANAVWGAPQY